MGKYKDLTGMVLYGLTVIKMDEEKSKEKHRGYWFCKCNSCGKVVEYSTDYLLNRKKSNSCGCLFSSKASDEVGKKYGRLTVLSRNMECHKRKKASWTCLCECGNIAIVNTDALHSGHTVSCGCKGKEFYKYTSKALINEVGNQYGALTVIKRDLEKKDSGAWWICKCGCGKIISCRGANLRAGYNISCGCKAPSRGEITIETLLKKYQVSYKTQYTFPNFTFKETGGIPRFDFAFFSKEKLVFLLEYNGIQHYKQVEYFKEPTSVIQSRDNQKITFCQENNIPLEIIPYTEFDNLETIICSLLKEYDIYKEE